MKINAKSLLITMSLTMAFACKKAAQPDAVAAGPFLDLPGRDTTVRAQDDFFSYANGTWFNTVEIPADQTGWGSFYTLYEENQKKTKTLLDEAAGANATKGSVKQKVGDFYASAMDTATIEKLGYEPIKGELAKVDAVKTAQDLLDFLASQEYNRGGAFFGMYIGPDDRRSDINRINFVQSGTGLPEKDYYTSKDATNISLQLTGRSRQF